MNRIAFFLFGSIGTLVMLTLMSACENGQTKEIPSTEAVFQDPVTLVYPQLDTDNSRWFLFSSACRPFGMVNLSPDTQLGGTWGSGYRYKTDTIKGFSHIHAWQLSGLSVMPVLVSDDNRASVFGDYASKFSHDTEKVSPGYHYVELDRYQIKAELTSTKRVGLHRYTFPKDRDAAILFNVNGNLGPCTIEGGTLLQQDAHSFSGSMIVAPTSRRPKPVTVFYAVELNDEIKAIDKDAATGNYLLVLKEPDTSVLMKVGISYTSVENARNNMEQELPAWNFDQVVTDSKTEWNDLLGRIRITGGTETAQRRFYTDLWHALQGRRTISDANGAYPDQTGPTFRIGQLPLDAQDRPKFNHYNSDSFWGAQWTINTLWGLVYPEIMEEFVHSFMQYYRDGGLIPRGPSGGNYTYVMTGASSTPFFVSAIQKGIIADSLEVIYTALKKNHSPGGIMEKAGYEHTTNKGGGFPHYLQNGYVPYPIPEGRFGSHQDGASLTLEYAYQDWTLAQLAKKLGYREDYDYFLQRSKNFQNVYDKTSGWMRPKDVNGQWKADFDPYQVEHGFIESNAAQATWFVPHDIEGLAELMGGTEKAVERLNGQFEAAQELGFTSGSSHDVESHPEYSRIPINYGNQPSMQTAFVFNHLNRPDLTQYWSQKVVDTVFSGLSPSTGYNGDEDQGLMGSLAVLMKLGLYQLNGGTEEDPSYDLGSPTFETIEIRLNQKYYPGKTFTIRSQHRDAAHWLIGKKSFNGENLEGFKLRHSQIVKGGELLLEFEKPE